MGKNPNKNRAWAIDQIRSKPMGLPARLNPGKAKDGRAFRRAAAFGIYTRPSYVISRLTTPPPLCVYLYSKLGIV